MADLDFGLIGRKIGMTQVFQDDGTMVAVSVVAIEPNTVTRLRTPDRDGYTAVQLGTDVKKKLSKPETCQLKDLPKVGTIREFRVDSVDGMTVGQTFALGDLFAAGFLFGLSRGVGHESAGRLGALAAAEVIQHIGARPQVSLMGLARQNGLPV